MAQAKNYDMAVYPVQVAVRSQADGAAVHMVTLPHCDCADFTNRKGRLVDGAGSPHVSVCKHIAAALERIGGWHGPEPEPKVWGILMHAEARELLIGPEVCLPPRTAYAVLRRASNHDEATFTTLGGALCDGHVAYDRLQSRYTVTLRK